MDINAFYLTVAGFSFTLIGLWWNVVQTRHAEWRNDPKMHTLARSVVTAFLCPAIMSLAAALSGEIKLIWQLAFLVSSVAGFWATLPFVSLVGGYARISLLASLVLYLVVCAGSLIALFAPGWIEPLKPLQLEGLLITLLLLCGVSLAWELLWDER